MERQEEPPQVYWSVPPGWLPAGVLVPKQEVALLLRLLARLPEDNDRDRILSRITSAAPSEAQPDLTTWVNPGVTDHQSRWLQRAEDSIRDHAALRVRYFSPSRGTADSREISFQRITSGAPIRLCGHCHRSQTLKWFRLDNILEVEGPAKAEYVQANENEINTMVSSTVDGFHSEQDSCKSIFTVRMPDARWVQHSLPPPMRSEPIVSGRQQSRHSVPAGALGQGIRSIHLADVEMG